MEWYYVWWPWLTSKRVARVCQHQLSFVLLIAFDRRDVLMASAGVNYDIVGSRCECRRTVSDTVATETTTAVQCIIVITSISHWLVICSTGRHCVCLINCPLPRRPPWIHNANNNEKTVCNQKPAVNSANLNISPYCSLQAILSSVIAEKPRDANSCHLEMFSRTKKSSKSTICCRH